MGNNVFHGGGILRVSKIFSRRESVCIEYNPTCYQQSHCQKIAHSDLKNSLWLIQTTIQSSPRGCVGARTKERCVPEIAPKPQILNAQNTASEAPPHGRLKPLLAPRQEGCYSSTGSFALYFPRSLRRSTLSASIDSGRCIQYDCLVTKF
jgi:hypothetical protein